MSLKLFLKSEICLIIGISSTTLSLSLVVVLYHNYDIYRYVHVWAISFPGTKSWTHPLSGFSFKLHTSTSTVKPCSCITNFDRLISVSYTHLRAHETRHDLVCRLLLEKKKKQK